MAHLPAPSHDLDHSHNQVVDPNQVVQGQLQIGGQNGRQSRYISREEEEEHAIAKKKAEHCQNMTVYFIVLCIFYVRLFTNKSKPIHASFEQIQAEYVQIYYFVCMNLGLFLVQTLIELTFMCCTSPDLMEVSNKVGVVVFIAHSFVTGYGIKHSWCQKY